MKEETRLAGYTRISAILDPLHDFSMIDEAVLEEKKRIGTLIHKAIELDAEGLCAPLPRKANGYFESYQKWLNLSGYGIRMTEQRLYCDRLKITGKFDAFVMLDQKNVLVDFKTSAVAAPHIWPLQGMFYHYLAKQNGYNMHDDYLFVQLNRDGNAPRVFKWKQSDLIWRQCLKLYNQYHADRGCNKKGE